MKLKSLRLTDIVKKPDPQEIYYGVEVTPYRWLPYKEGAPQLKKGIKGRWQKRELYGWENSEPPDALLENYDDWLVAEASHVHA